MLRSRKVSLSKLKEVSIYKKILEIQYKFVIMNIPTVLQRSYETFDFAPWYLKTVVYG